MNDIDKYFAEHCGVEIKTHAPHHEVEMYARMKGVWEEWTISDPRCREVCRERFFHSAHYLMMPDGVMRLHIIVLEKHYNGVGKTIAEAEIACLQSIYEARDE